MKAVLWRQATTLHHAEVDARQTGKRWTVILPAGVAFDADDMLQLDGRMLVNLAAPSVLPDGRTAATMYDPREGPPCPE